MTASIPTSAPRIRARAIANAVPLDRVLVETDAPYLAPEPYRGKQNEPAFVVKTLEVLAQVCDGLAFASPLYAT